MTRKSGIDLMSGYRPFVRSIAPEDPVEPSIYRKLVEVLHPAGLACPRCGATEGLRVHRRHREPVIDYLCTECFRVFNAWTGTALQGTHRPPSEILYIMHGIEAGASTSFLARELGCRRPSLIALRRRLEPLARSVVEKVARLGSIGLDVAPREGPGWDARPPDASREYGEPSRRHDPRRPARAR